MYLISTNSIYSDSDDDDDDKTQSSDNGEKSECESDIASGNDSAKDDSAKDDSAKKARTVPRTEPRTVPMYRGKAKTVPKKLQLLRKKKTLPFMLQERRQ